MEFRLVYEGSLPASGGGGRVIEKHAIRRQLHPQLKQLWEIHPVLISIRTDPAWAGLEPAYAESILVDDPNPELPEQVSYFDSLVCDFARHGFSFIPLVTTRMHLVCSLDILFLRRDAPGELLKSGGDLDNRIKVLFDALTVPADGSQIPSVNNSKQGPDEGEVPFYCLLQDDALVTSVNVTTDRLLIPVNGSQNENDVKLIIQVKVSATHLDALNIGLIST